MQNKDLSTAWLTLLTNLKKKVRFCLHCGSVYDEYIAEFQMDWVLSALRR